MQSQVSRDFASGNRSEMAQCFEGPLSPREPASQVTGSDVRDQCVPFLREVEAMVDHAMKAFDSQISDCVQALINDMPAAGHQKLVVKVSLRNFKSSKIRSTQKKGN